MAQPRRVGLLKRATTTRIVEHQSKSFVWSRVVIEGQQPKRKLTQLPFQLGLVLIFVLVVFFSLPGIQRLSLFYNSSTINESPINTTTLFPSKKWYSHSAADGNSTGKPPGSAIFYNIYVNASERDHGIRIITEQTQQIFQQLSSRRKESEARIPLYYNMIGHNHSEPFCPFNMTCIFLEYYKQGFEEVTLQSLYEYCLDHPRDHVYYLHNKGSYTKSESN